MKIKKEKHKEFGQTLQLLRDALLQLSVQNHQSVSVKTAIKGKTRVKRENTIYTKALKLTDKLRSAMDEIEAKEHGTIECYYVAKNFPYNHWEEAIEVICNSHGCKNKAEFLVDDWKFSRGRKVPFCKECFKKFEQYANSNKHEFTFEEL